MNDEQERWKIERAAEPGDWFESARAVIESHDLDVRAFAVAVLKDRLPDIERDVVEAALADGAFPARVGEALGISRQAIHKRFGPGAAPGRVPATRVTIERRLAKVAERRAREQMLDEMWAGIEQRRRAAG
jgi:hypothetical protein